MKQIDTTTALKHINRWLDEQRAVKVAIIGSLAEVIDSGWGSAMTDDVSLLRLVYKPDNGGVEVDQTIDVSGSTATEGTIWDAPPALGEKYSHFDEGIGFALPNGRTILLMCTAPAKQSAH